MNAIHTHILPDDRSVASELTFGDSWDSAAVSGLIRSKCSFGESPAFLFLGRHEAGLLRDHLAAAFGEDAVPTLRDSYYMGLEVVAIDCESFVYAGGRKTSRSVQDQIARRSVWKDRESDSLWQLRL